MSNEFRQDPLTSDWVLIAPSRAHKPENRERIAFTPHPCPFDGLQSFVEILPNKYPAVTAGQCGPIISQGVYSVAAGVGVHELVVTKDHDRHFSNFTDEEMRQVVTIYRNRYRELATDECNKYISIFHNHGVLGGASIYHNHSQILTAPVIPPEITKMLGTRANELLVAEKERTVCENETFVAFCPFASRSPFEVNIFPKQSQSDFGALTDMDVDKLAAVMREVFIRLDKAVGDPDYTYFIHTTPPRSKDMLDWHIEIMPRFSPVAGFELGTGIFINVVDPDEAADKLRNVSLS
jgi:UDPglucose--hexose-1-phosphate uridylyltransferase